jgi:hypothetical protein
MAFALRKLIATGALGERKPLAQRELAVATPGGAAVVANAAGSIGLTWLLAEIKPQPMAG